MGRIHVLSGRYVGRHRCRATPDRGWRRLVAALLLQALDDALGGDAEAGRWLDRYAPSLAARWLGLNPRRVTEWRSALEHYLDLADEV